MPSPLLTGRRLFALVVVLLLATLWLTLHNRAHRRPVESTSAERPAAATQSAPAPREPYRFKRITRTEPTETGTVSAAAIVQQKLVRFAQGRLELARALAASNHINLSPRVEAFFTAVEAGDWAEQKRLLEELRASPPDDPERADGWQLVMQAVKETSGVAEAVRTWPPERLLQYGEAVLGALKPGMVYVGGTDGGRFIPTLLNDTMEGERHVVLTQNALADGSYLAYARFRYGEQMKLPDPAESQQCFQDYLKDFQARALHDQQFPAEPAQLRPGETVRIKVQVTDNLVQVSGQVAVMAINEKLLTTLMDKNPGLSFALEESFSLPSTYAGALPSGPLLELRAASEDNPLTPERAAGSLDYWRGVQQDLAVEAPDSEMRQQYAKMAVAQANLFACEGLTGEAEQGYRLAHELAPALPEAILGLAGALQAGGRTAEAGQLLRTLPAGK